MKKWHLKKFKHSNRMPYRPFHLTTLKNYYQMKSIFIFIGIIVANVAIAQYDPKALEILEAMGKKYKAIPSFEVNFSQVLTNESAGVKEEVKGKITVKGDKYKLELSEQQVYNNGTTIWTY